MVAGGIELYPLRTEAIYRYYVCGGSRLATLLSTPLGPAGTLAEEWEIGDETRVAKGPLRDQTLTRSTQRPTAR
jgi:hypothetical protein